LSPEALAGQSRADSPVLPGREGRKDRQPEEAARAPGDSGKYSKNEGFAPSRTLAILRRRMPYEIVKNIFVMELMIWPLHKWKVPALIGLNNKSTCQLTLTMKN
jgi:hypothetical protein